MSLDASEFAQSISFIRPERPKPLVVELHRPLDWWRLNRGDIESRQEYVRHIRMSMARELADFIFQNCAATAMPALPELQRDLAITMNFTINDRLAYEAWLPKEKKLGVELGRKLAIAELPYGFEVNAFYE